MNLNLYCYVYKIVCIYIVRWCGSVSIKEV